MTYYKKYVNIIIQQDSNYLINERYVHMTKTFFKIITVLLLNVLVVTSVVDKSYANLDNLTFNNMNIEKGISQSTVEVLFQDSKGYIWLGTNDGLNRYNGYEYKIYNYEENQNSISHNGITDIAEDKDGNIWVGTVQGINKLNPYTEEIINYTENNSKIKDDSITEIVVTKDNKVLAGSYEGISIYNEKKDCFETVLNVDNKILSNNVYSIDIDSDNNIWIGTDLGVNKISKDFKVLESYPINDEENYLGNSEIYKIYCDDKNNLVWAGSSQSGLFKINKTTNEITAYKNNPEDEKSLPSNQIGDVLRDSKNNLWVATSNGLAYYDENNDNFDVYKNKIYDKNSLVYDHVKSLMEDKEGIIWVGTYSGVSIFDTENGIKHYKAGLDDDYLLNESMVHGVYEDDEGYLWVGSKSKGVSIIDRDNQSSTFISTENNSVILDNTINDITGYKNLIFIATDGGIIKIDKESKTMKSYTTEDGLVNDYVKDILLDDNKYLWIGTSNGLSILNIETDEIIDMRDVISESTYVKHMYKDSEGNYFLGLLRDEGLCYINTKNNNIKYFKNEPNNKDSISSNRIRYINEDSKGNIWIGTSYGLNKFDKKSETFERYTAKDGIANNTIYGVLVDKQDNVWISTNKGISKINSDTNKIENFSVVNGLQGNEFNGNASFVSKSGELFFGGVNGLNAFYPEDINKVNLETKVLFDGFNVDSKNYLDINNMKFKNNTHAIKINFFAPIYSSNKNLMYEYELEGTGSGTSTTKESSVTYNELSPGRYTFKVRVIDTGGNKSEVTKVTFTVKNPWWITPPAIALYIGIIVYAIIRNKNKVNRLNALVSKRTKDLEEEMKKNTVLHNENIKLERNKNSYFVNLSHELRTPLNVISSTNQLLKGLVKKDSAIGEEKLNYYVDISEKNCKRLLNLINNILDNSKLQCDMYEINTKEADIVYLVEETALTMYDYIKSKGIELIIDPEIEEKTIECDYHEIERCIINIVSNAAKYTPEGGTITVGIKDLDDKVMINIKDTGCGIDEKFHEAIFNRFSQASEEDSKIGSGLGLTITKQIIDLHKGEIYVESKLGEGSNFVIILPTKSELN